MTSGELAYALNDTVAWVSFGFFMSALGIALRVTWPRWR